MNSLRAVSYTHLKDHDKTDYKGYYCGVCDSFRLLAVEEQHETENDC